MVWASGRVGPRPGRAGRPPSLLFLFVPTSAFFPLTHTLTPPHPLTHSLLTRSLIHSLTHQPVLTNAACAWIEKPIPTRSLTRMSSSRSRVDAVHRLMAAVPSASSPTHSLTHTSLVSECAAVELAEEAACRSRAVQQLGVAAYTVRTHSRTHSLTHCSTHSLTHCSTHG